MIFTGCRHDENHIKKSRQLRNFYEQRIYLLYLRKQMTLRRFSPKSGVVKSFQGCIDPRTAAFNTNRQVDFASHVRNNRVRNYGKYEQKGNRPAGGKASRSRILQRLYLLNSIP